MIHIVENGMHALVADTGKVIRFADGFCDKLYRKSDDFSDCYEAEKPIEPDEATESDYQATLAEMGVMLNGE